MLKRLMRRRLIALLIPSGLLLRHLDARAATSPEQVGDDGMADQDKERSKADKKKSPPAAEEMVITPAGPVPKKQVHEVKPGEAVRRNKNGSLTKVPRSDQNQ